MQATLPCGAFNIDCSVPGAAEMIMAQCWKLVNINLLDQRHTGNNKTCWSCCVIVPDILYCGTWHQHVKLALKTLFNNVTFYCTIHIWQPILKDLIFRKSCDNLHIGSSIRYSQWMGEVYDVEESPKVRTPSSYPCAAWGQETILTITSVCGKTDRAELSRHPLCVRLCVCPRQTPNNTEAQLASPAEQKESQSSSRSPLFCF